jgi:acetyl-CoA carboxylase carboxyl transferase subunit alpha
MPQLKNRQYLEFEKPVKYLYDQIEQLQTTQEQSQTDMSSSILALEQKILYL